MVINLFHFCNLSTQQQSTLKEQYFPNWRKIALQDNLHDFPRAHEQAGTLSWILLSGPKNRIGTTLLKDNLFTHCFKFTREIFQLLKTSIFAVWRKKECVFSILEIDLYEDKLIPADIVNSYKNRYLIGYNCGFCRSHFDLKNAHNKRSNKWRVLLEQKLQRRKNQTSWWSCNYSKIHLRLWKVQSMVTCSQRILYHTAARKYNKSGWSTFFVLQRRWTCYLASKCPLISQINQPITGRKKRSTCVWTIEY